MQTPLNASASSAGALFSSTTFEIPEFQRDYSWGLDEVSEFWNDLKNNIDADTYFLGLIILTSPSEDEGTRKYVVDGQQRIITLSLLATAIYHEAVQRERKALADRIQADFLRSIDYDSDETAPRVKLSDEADDLTFQAILATGKPRTDGAEEDSVSNRMTASYEYLTKKLRDDLKVDPFKRLGRWTDFLTNRLYFAVFETARANGSNFSRVVLISHDKKIDWSREGTPHPILIAEVMALTGASFEIWSLDKLARELLD